MDEYKRILHEWALSTLPRDLGAVRVISADVDYYRGFGGSDITPADDPELSISIRYATADGSVTTYTLYDNEDNAMRMSELLQDLFRLAEATS